MGISLEGCILFAPLKKSTHINSRAFCYFFSNFVCYVRVRRSKAWRGRGWHTHTHIDRTAKSKREREKERKTSTKRARARARARDRDGERYKVTQKWCHAKQRDLAREWEKLGDTCRSEYTLRIDIHNFCAWLHRGGGMGRWTKSRPACPPSGGK